LAGCFGLLKRKNSVAQGIHRVLYTSTVYDFVKETRDSRDSSASSGPALQGFGCTRSLRISCLQLRTDTKLLVLWDSGTGSSLRHGRTLGGSERKFVSSRRARKYRWRNTVYHQANIGRCHEIDAANRLRYLCYYCCDLLQSISQVSSDASEAIHLYL